MTGKKSFLTDRSPVRDFVREYMARRGIVVRFDHGLSIAGLVRQADKPEDVAEALTSVNPTLSQLEDLLVLRGRMAKYSSGAIKTALRLEVHAQRDARFAQVVSAIMDEYQQHDKGAAIREWERLNDLFEVEGLLAAIVLQSFIWAVKQKALDRKVTRHLMPIIFSPLQGTGKTMFVRKFVSPLQELAADGVLFSDMADRRSGDIFRYPVVILDDMEQLSASSVPIIKTVLTAESLRRRILMTSMSAAIQQQCMPIGTSNQPIGELVPDSTGNRRFVTLQFRNGDKIKGGDAAVWATVNDIDYLLLWQSVNPFGSNPVLPYLDEVRVHQGQWVPPSPFRQWLIALDLTSEALRSARTRGGYYADALREQFMLETGQEMTQRLFADQMALYISRGDSPFGAKSRDRGGVFYIPKSAALPTLPHSPL